MRNVIITGGELFNKGAQAMTFVTVSELKKRFPKHRILLLSTEDLKRPEKERNQYTFDFIGWYPIKFAKAQKNPMLRAVCMFRNKKEFNECEEIYRNCDLILDISGYAIGDNWDYYYCKQYLEHIEFAKCFGIPMYMMPQSLGPFNFVGEHAAELNQLCKKLFPYPLVICAREQEGYEMIKKAYNLSNVVLLPDLVLNNRGVETADIFTNSPRFYFPTIPKNSVGIIPNVRTLDLCGEEELLSMYKKAISAILKQGNTTYILSHATCDIELCRKLKQSFIENKNVILIDSDLNCIEFNHIVKQFKYVIASRFHAIVHAMKNGIPCIAIGWAIKYYNLLSMFGQEDYVFDVHDEIETEELEKAIDRINCSVLENSINIKRKLIEIQKENVFNIIGYERGKI